MKKDKPTISEILGNISGWVKGAIAYLTAIVSFIVLFRDNLELMVAVIIIITSIALFVTAYRIVTEKTAPLILGGKGLPKYPKLRLPGIVVLAAIPIFDLIFFSSGKGRDLVTISLYGPPTPTPEVIIKTTPTIQPTPSLANLIKTETGSGCDGFNFIIPSDIDLNQPEFDLAKLLYSQKVWQIWDILSFTPGLNLGLTNIQSKDGDTVIIDNDIQIVVDEYQPLDYVNVAIFTQNGHALGHGNCGGGGSGRNFSAATLTGTTNSYSTSKEYDYFTLQPGEYEEFIFSLECGEPGLYRYHLVLDATMGEMHEKIAVGKSLTTYCPKAFSARLYDEVISDYTDSNIMHTIAFSGNYELDNQGLFTHSTAGSTVTIPWAPCEKSPESYIFPVSYNGMIATDIDVPVNIRLDPSLSSPIVSRGDPGQKLVFRDGPTCADGLVWWNVEWRILNSINEFVGVQNGWIAESNGTDRWLLSCPGYQLSMTLYINSSGHVESNNWCR